MIHTADYAALTKYTPSAQSKLTHALAIVNTSANLAFYGPDDRYISQYLVLLLLFVCRLFTRQLSHRQTPFLCAQPCAPWVGLCRLCRLTWQRGGRLRVPVSARVTARVHHACHSDLSRAGRHVGLWWEPGSQPALLAGEVW